MNIDRQRKKQNKTKQRTFKSFVSLCTTIQKNKAKIDLYLDDKTIKLLREQNMRKSS